MNEKTINYYNKNAEAFVAGTENADMQYCRERFLQHLKCGRTILDAGCGSGRDTIAFREAGYEVDAFDASEEMCRIASERTGIPVRHLRFEELEGEAQYDGIWACASLLHVERDDLPEVLQRLHRLLKDGGILYASFKYGTGERVKEGRYFHDLTDQDCREVLEKAGFAVLEMFISGDVRPGREDEKWVNAVAGKSE